MSVSAVKTGFRARQRTFVPSKVPAFQVRFGDFEVGRCILSRLASLCNGKGKVLVGLASVGLAAVDRRVDFEPDIKVLAGKEVDSVQITMCIVQRCAGPEDGLLVRRKDASKGRTCSEPLEGLRIREREQRGHRRSRQEHIEGHHAVGEGSKDVEMAVRAGYQQISGLRSIVDAPLHLYWRACLP